MHKKITVRTDRQGLYEITEQVQAFVRSTLQGNGLCNVYVQHTSASLLIQENADPSARHDLEVWLQRLVPEGESRFTHNSEGPDDMPAHIKAAITSSNLTIPIIDGDLALGTWQGIYLWEHRISRHNRSILISVV